MKKLFRKEHATAIGMVIIGIILIIGILFRWEYFLTEASGAFKSLFAKPETIQTDSTRLR